MGVRAVPPPLPSSVTAAACMLLLVLLLAPAQTEAANCGPQAGGRKCPGANQCCSNWGWCGTGERFCGPGRCHSGACQGKAPPKPQPQPSGTWRTAFAVKDKTAVARCPKNQVVTKVQHALYGNKKEACKADRSYSVVAKACLRKRACSVDAFNSVFSGDPCPGTQKALYFQYRCGKKRAPQPRPTRPPRPQRPSPGGSSGARYYSQLWGQAGERWSPNSPLADWSYAGYAGNEHGIPAYSRVFNVKDGQFGAKGDGKADDTAAIRRAIDAASEAAVAMSTYLCGSTRRCLLPHKGFQNDGRQGAVVYLPPGTYMITQTLEILQSNVVLRGAGVSKTKLYFPKGLQAIYGNREQWATGGAFLIIDGNNAGSNQEDHAIAKVTSDARKGARRVQVERTGDIQVGQWIRFYALAPSPARRRLAGALGTTDARNGTASARPNNSSRDSDGVLPLTAALERQLAMGQLYAEAELAPEGVVSAARPGTLDAYLYGGNLVDSGRNAFEGTDHIRFPSRVVAKGDNWVELERPLPYDLRTEWNVWVYNFYSTVQHSGVEGFTISFAWDIYPEHLKSKGFNAVELSSVSNCWVRNINIINADIGVSVTQADFISVYNIGMWVTKPRYSKDTYPDNGHHALWVGRSGDVAFFNFNIKSPLMHDISVDGFAERTVWSNGVGANMNIDCHRAGPHNHLFSNLDLGRGYREFKSGGEDSRGAHSGANNTFWNVHVAGGRGEPQLPDCDFGPLLNFVGKYAEPEAYQGRAGNGRTFPGWCKDKTRWFVEQVPPGKRLQPQDLYQAMVATRRKRLRLG